MDKIKCDRCEKEFDSSAVHIGKEGSILTTVNTPHLVYMPSYIKYVTTGEIEYVKQLRRLENWQIGFHLEDKQLCEECLIKLAYFMKGELQND